MLFHSSQFPPTASEWYFVIWHHSVLLSSQHSLTCTADLVLERLSQRVSTLTAASERDSAEAEVAEEKDDVAEESALQTPFQLG